MATNRIPGQCVVCNSILIQKRINLVDEYLCTKCQTYCQKCNTPVMSKLTNGIGIPIDKTHLLCPYSIMVEHMSHTWSKVH
jgi:hypothetical protein